MRQREVLEFRTPQHPSLGRNHWGGASPMLARNIPKESLEQRYLRLNTIRTRDEIFPEIEDDFYHLSATESSRYESASTPSRRGLLSKLLFWRSQTKLASLGSTPKKKWLFQKWDPKNRWPQGWC